MKKFLILTLLSTSILTHVSSQCLTDYYYKEALKKDPGIALQQQAFFESVVQVSNNKRVTKYIIPVVFHVIHTNGPENISKAQIEDQIRILNLDYSYMNANKSAIRSAFTGVAADVQIEFRLAKIDPSGNCTDGINRVYNPGHVNARDEVKSISGAHWDYKKYLNIWTVSSIREEGSTGGTTLGYAYLPTSVSAGMTSMDGIVVRADYVGTIGTGNPSNSGRTLTHEIGHYLGLLHTFEGGCAGVGTGNGDNCGDTPPVSGTFTNANCPSNGNSCSTDNPNLVDQWENYMDYSRGSCQAMFTLNQKSIMHSCLTNFVFRKNLVSAANLVATGVNTGSTAPVAYFYSSSRMVCTGEPVTFYDISCKAQVDSRQWTFAGANITSTNKDTPVVVYNTPGKYKVTLMVTNSKGNNTLAVDEYITVRPSVAIDKPAMIQDFESNTWNIGTGWTVQATNFDMETSTAWHGSNCIVAPISSSVVAGQRYQLITPPIDLRALKGKSPKISMMVGYLRQSTSSSEELRLYQSRGCGDDSWTQFLFRNASFISYNVSQFANDFKPGNPSQWKLISMSLNGYENDSNISFMVEVVSGSGNPVYIDAINISSWNTDISDIEQNIALNVYPNPTTGVLNVNYTNQAGETEVWLEDIQGKRIHTLLETSGQTGDISLNWNSQGLLPSGVYILKIKSNDQIINKKIIFAN